MEVFHRSTPLFISQIDLVSFGILAQSCQKLSESDLLFEKYNSSDDDSDFEGYPQADIRKATATHATMARPITSLAMDIDTTDEEHSCDSDNSKSDVSADEVSYIFVRTVPKLASRKSMNN